MASEPARARNSSENSSGRLIDVHSDPNNRAERLAAASLRLDQNTGDFASADVDIVRRFDLRLEPGLTADRIRDSLRRPGR